MEQGNNPDAEHLYWTGRVFVRVCLYVRENETDYPSALCVLYGMNRWTETQ